jgi:hypothetical protein
MELMALRCFYYMGKKAEVIPKGKQSIFVNFDFTFGIKIGKDSSVLSQQPVNIPDKIV